MPLIALLFWLFALPLTAQAEGFPDDGHYQITYNRLAFDLMQIGEYGALEIKTAGFGDLRFGKCSYTFRRDDQGVMVEHSPPIASGTARCPEKIAFFLSEDADGYYKITFDAGRYLQGQSYRLIPLIRRFSPDLQTPAPKGFDILGISPVMSRPEVEEKLLGLGFSPHPFLQRIEEIPDLYSQTLEVWIRGERPEGGAEDALGLTYSSLSPDKDQEELLHISRLWHPPAHEGMKGVKLRDSLSEKYGAAAAESENRYYDRNGQWQPLGPICASDIRLLPQKQKTLQIDKIDEFESSPACGASVKIAITENELVERLEISLEKPDLLYADFWRKWSLFHALILESDFHRAMAEQPAAPKL